MINARLLEHAICKGFCKYQDYSSKPYMYGKVNIERNILGNRGIYNCQNSILDKLKGGKTDFISSKYRV